MCVCSSASLFHRFRVADRCVRKHAGCKHILHKQRGLPSCELQLERAYHFKNNYHSRRRLHFLSGNVCVCSSETSGQWLHCFNETKSERKMRDSQQGLLTVWDWEEGLAWFDLEEPSDCCILERLKGQRQALLTLCVLPLEMTHLLSVLA